MILKPDRDQIEIFVEALFRYAGTEGFVSLRAFYEDESTKPFRITPTGLTGGLRFLIEAAEDDANRAANHPRKVVFCPPIATFNNKHHAGEKDLIAGLALSVECDERTRQAREKLEAILGPATIVVASGGRWQDEDKLHLHWRLAMAAHGGDLAILKEARELAAHIVGGDTSNVPIVHCIRWPGSWHRKGEPVLCRIVHSDPDAQIDLAKAVTALRAVAPATWRVNGSSANAFSAHGAADGAPAGWKELIEGMLVGKDLHDCIAALASKYIASGMSDGAAVNSLRGFMNASTAKRDARWQARYDDIPRAVKTAREKFGGQSSGNDGEQQQSQVVTLSSTKASSVKMTAVTWLWPNRFAIGKLGLIAGLPDEGKGQVICYIIAKITSVSDKHWPCNEGMAPDGNVILFSAEDDPSDTIVPRLVAAGADLDRIEIVKMVVGDAKNRKERMFSLITDLDLLHRKVLEVGNVKAIVIDPVTAYLGHGKMDSFRTTDVRAVLAPLVDLAAELGVAIIGVMHFNKKLDVTNALLRISDSLAFGATSRHAYAVVDDAENKRKLLVRAKNNLARKQRDKALAYRFAECKVGIDEEKGEEIWAPYIVWDPKHVDVTTTEAMQAANETKSPAARDGAKKFLQDMLANGPVLKTEIEDAAEANGIARRTLFRAKDELQIKAVKEKGKAHGKWYWELPANPARRWDID